MTISEATYSFLLMIFISSSIGILIRAYQEKTHPLLFATVYFIFLMHLFVDFIILPLIFMFRVIFNKTITKRNFEKRLFYFIFAYPICHMLILSDFKNQYDEFWISVRKVSDKLKLEFSTNILIKGLKYQKINLDQHIKLIISRIEKNFV